MTVEQLRKLSIQRLKVLAYEYNLRTAADFTKEDYIASFVELLGDDTEAWETINKYIYIVGK